MKFIWLIALSAAGMLYAQSGVERVLELRDAQSKRAVYGVHYRYGGQKGASTPEGLIRLNSADKDTLFLSHVRYGAWYITPEELKKMSPHAVIYREEIVMHTEPVTVIAVRPQSAKSARIELNVQEQLAHDAGTVLSSIPAINGIRKSGGYGLDPVMRGFKYDQLNIVIDGAQTAAAACPNRMDPPTSQITPNMMRAVHVIKGPHSFRYGSSFGGTINFESLPLRIGEQEGFYGRWSAGGESNGAVMRTEGVAGWRGEWYDVSALGSWSSGNDYTNGSGRKTPATFSRGSVGLNAGFLTGKSQEWRVSLSQNKAGLSDFPALPMDLVSDRTTLFNVRHVYYGHGGALYRWQSSAYFTRVDHAMNNLHKDINPRKLDAETTARTYTAGGRSEGIWMWESLKFYGGVDLRVQQAEGTRKRSFLMGPMAGKTVYDNVWNGGQIIKSGLFAELHHFLGSGKLIYSGRLEWNHAKATDPDEGFVQKTGDLRASDMNFGLSIGGVMQYQKFNYGLWLGSARRSAGLSERYINSFPVGLDPYDMLGSPQLKPEVNNEADITLGYGGEFLQLKANLFTSYLVDYISSEIDTSLTATMPSSPGVRRYVNVPEALKYGLELSAEHTLFKGVTQRLSLAYTYGKNLTMDEPLPEIAPLDVRYMITTPLWNRLNTRISVRYVAQQNRVSREFGERPSPAFTTADVHLTYRFNRTISLALDALNLFDAAYYEHLTRSVRGTDRPIYAPGRNFIFTVTFNRL